LFEKYLSVDWFGKDNINGGKETNGNKNIFLIAPAIKGYEGREYPANPMGVCAFFDEKNKKCMIHPVKPFECKKMMHDHDRIVSVGIHRQAALTWTGPNEEKTLIQIRSLLKREPVETKPTTQDIIEMMLDQGKIK
jgi:hypothetical protein